MSNILILAGGTSGERDVSLRSGAAVAAALRARGHQVDIMDPAEPLPILTHYDIAFPALHGSGGEDGTIQAELEIRGLPYVGSDTTVSARCFNKQDFKLLLESQGIDTPQGEVVSAATIWDSPLIRQPFVLKPVSAGSSIDTFIVRNPEQIDTLAINTALTRHPEMLLEELISGIEITVGVVGDAALPVIEIIPPASGEFDYENKYNGQTQELCPPEHVSSEAQLEAQRLALLAHQAAGCHDLSRTDMIVMPSGRIVVLELNTLPGMTDQSLLPKAAAVAGMDMEDLCDRLIQMALKRQAAASA